MPEVIRGGPRSLVGQEFYDIEELDTFSYCPDSSDASTPATQVHLAMKLSSPLLRERFPRLVARFRGPGVLDALIEALIEHRTYVFGRRTYRYDWPEQKP